MSERYLSPREVFLILLVVAAAVPFLIGLIGCSNNYLEWRRFTPCKQNGYKIAEYKAGRQSLLVNSSWDVAAVRLDPNEVSMTGKRILSDPEQVRLVTPYGVIEGGDAAPSIPGTVSQDENP